MSILGRTLRRVFPALGRAIDESRLPEAARAEKRKDAQGLPAEDPGIERFVAESLAWIGRAQDCSPTHDGGVARDYSLVSGWTPSYPETTGYIVPTMLDCGARFGDDELTRRGLQMLDWLVGIQFEDGGFQGGRIDANPVVPVTFNTGQILIGLARGARDHERYREPMERAARWLAESLDDDGCWRRFPTPFAKPGEKAYETHVSWGLFEAERVVPGKGYGEAGLRQVRWALTQQAPNGWFANCCLTNPDEPLTHTLGYVLRGVIEAYLLDESEDLLSGATLTANALADLVDDEGYLPGQLGPDWRASVRFACLTGTVQIAHCLLLLYRLNGNEHLRDTAYRMNRFVRRTVDVSGRDEVRGAVKGSFPVDGDYGRYEYLNWAAKFAIDANLLEQDIRTAEGA